MLKKVHIVILQVTQRRPLVFSRAPRHRVGCPGIGDYSGSGWSRQTASVAIRTRSRDRSSYVKCGRPARVVHGPMHTATCRGVYRAIHSVPLQPQSIHGPRRSSRYSKCSRSAVHGFRECLNPASRGDAEALHARDGDHQKGRDLSFRALVGSLHMLLGPYKHQIAHGTTRGALHHMDCDGTHVCVLLGGDPGRPESSCRSGLRRI